MKFIGRSREVSLLNQLAEKESASLVVIYGRRRVGKSRLIEEFGQSLKTYSFTGLHPDLLLTKEEQINEFSIQVGLEFKTTKPSYTDWSEAFYDLSQRTQTGKTLIILDEITWLGAKDSSFLGKLKIAWDKYFKKNPELILVLCGSVSSWIKKNILASTGFHGRISLTLHLKELPLSVCKAFWGSLSDKISAYEKLKILAVTGGIPKYLEEINPSLPAETNIKQLAVSETGILFTDFRQIFSDSLNSHNSHYLAIVHMLVSAHLTQSDIAKKLHIDTGGTLSEYLENLVLAGFITKHSTINLKTKKTSNISYYHLSDNYLRFYLKYILPNGEKIMAGNFEFSSFNFLPAWSSIIALQIENLVLNNRHEIITRLGIPKNEIIFDGPFIQRATEKNKGCQIDYLIQTQFNTLYLCEIKFSRNLIEKSIVDEIEQKIKALDVPKNTSIRPVLIHVGKLHDHLIDTQYFSNTIDLTQLLD